MFYRDSIARVASSTAGTCWRNPIWNSRETKDRLPHHQSTKKSFSNVSRAPRSVRQAGSASIHSFLAASLHIHCAIHCSSTSSTTTYHFA